MKDNSEEAYWSNRYEEQSTGWDIGFPSLPLKTYMDQVEDKGIKILIPGAGNAYEAEYLFQQGFTQVYVMDISLTPLENFKERVPEFPHSHLIQADFFGHDDTYDLILEQTFFCSFEPTKGNRKKYAEKMHTLLRPGGKLVGVLFNHPLHAKARRPFGGTRDEYLSYLSPLFDVQVFEDCYNSIEDRVGQELFGIFEKRNR